jgi:hypothetical protein
MEGRYIQGYGRKVHFENITHLTDIACQICGRKCDGVGIDESNLGNIRSGYKEDTPIRQDV